MLALVGVSVEPEVIIYRKEEPITFVRYIEASQTQDEVTNLPKEVINLPKKIDPYMCSCVEFVRDKGLIFKRINTPDDLIPNSVVTVGAGVLFKYPNGLAHIGYVNELRSGGFIISDRRILTDIDGNEYCKDEMRWVFWNDPSIRGFFLQ